MVSRLQEINSIVAHEINNAVFLCQSSRPTTRCEIFEWFRFANTIKRIAQNGVNQFKSAQSQFAIRLNPVTQIFDEFGLKDCFTFF